MDNSKKDSWLTMGNMGGNRSGEVTEEGLEREAMWNAAMEDAPAFAGENTLAAEGSPAEAENERDNNIADASAIINYGLNAAAREKGVEVVMEVINNFVPSGDQDPIKQLFMALGIEDNEERKDLRAEASAAKLTENEFKQDNINAPVPNIKSRENALYAINEVKELVGEVKTSPAYATLRAEALRAGKGIFEYAVSKYAVRDLTVLFDALNEQKEKLGDDMLKDIEESPEDIPEQAPMV